MISETLIEQVKIKCYVTDTNDLTITRLKNIINSALPKVKRMIGVNTLYDFEEEGNEEELELFLNYCWYAWNDSANEFKDNYLDDINSLHHKHEVEQYEQEKSE